LPLAFLHIQINLVHSSLYFPPPPPFFFFSRASTTKCGTPKHRN